MIKMSPRNRLTNTEVVDELVDEYVRGHVYILWSILGIHQDQVDCEAWIVSTASPRDCFSHWVADLCLWRPHTEKWWYFEGIAYPSSNHWGWITRPMKLLNRLWKRSTERDSHSNPKRHQNELFGSYSDLSTPYCVVAWNPTSAKPVWPSVFIVFISFRRTASRAHSFTFQKPR